MTATAQKAWINQLFDQLVLVEGDTFWMGDDDSPHQAEKPRHQVTVSTFQMAKYPVTQALWQEVMGNNPSHFKGENRPVENVSWDDICQTDGFLDRLNEVSEIKAKNAEDGKQFRLPTEAQWEYAARGGKEGAKDNFIYAGSNNLKEIGWYWNNNHEETKPIGLKFPNQLGLCDMSGNVWEWCADLWHTDYNHAPENGDEPYEKDGEKGIRVVRGGSWFFIDGDCRVADRVRVDANGRNFDMGFRLTRY